MKISTDVNSVTGSSDALPANEVSYRGYEVGEIVYWPPRHSFVILYAQNGEHFDMQPIGRIEKGVEEMDVSVP